MPCVLLEPHGSETILPHETKPQEVLGKVRTLFMLINDKQIDPDQRINLQECW